MTTSKLIAVLIIAVLGIGAFMYFSDSDEMNSPVPAVQDQKTDEQEGDTEPTEEMDDMSDATPAPATPSPVVETPKTETNVTNTTEVNTIPEDNQSEEVDTTLSGLDSLFDDEYDDSEVDASLEGNLNDSYDI